MIINIIDKIKNRRLDNLNILSRNSSRSESDKGKRFGVIETSIFKYLTPFMIVIASIVVVIVAFNVSTLYVYFETNVALNGLILGLLTFALGKAFYNNYELYKTAKFLKLIEDTIQKDHIEEDEVDKLHYLMVKNAYLLDTQYMHNSIENIRLFGYLNFSDKDARLIKSKLGYRVRLKKSDVGFIAGILVMLGLLGTFLGLLQTIDSVGAAMNSMSNIGGDGGVDESAMTGFISSLSAPLQGMGLAFSSSLFGLSGSLLIGYFNHLCGDAQDTFMENVSRWIDDRIPKFRPDKEPNATGNKPANEDDLRTWLAGFVYLSVKTNKKMGILTQSLIETIKVMKRDENALSEMVENQKMMAEVSRESKDALIAMSERLNNSSHQISEYMKHSNFVLGEIQKQSRQDSENTKELVSQSVSEISNVLQTSFTKIDDHIVEIEKFVAEKSKESMHFLNGMYQNMEDIKAYSKISNEGSFRYIGEIKDYIEQLNNEFLSKKHEIEKFSENLNQIVELLKRSQDDQQKVVHFLSANEETFNRAKQLDDSLDKMRLEINNLTSQIDQMSEDKLQELLKYGVA